MIDFCNCLIFVRRSFPRFWNSSIKRNSWIHANPPFPQKRVLGNEWPAEEQELSSHCIKQDVVPTPPVKTSTLTSPQFLFLLVPLTSSLCFLAPVAWYHKRLYIPHVLAWCPINPTLKKWWIKYARANLSPYSCLKPRNKTFLTRRNSIYWQSWEFSLCLSSAHHLAPLITQCPHNPPATPVNAAAWPGGAVNQRVLSANLVRFCWYILNEGVWARKWDKDRDRYRGIYLPSISLTGVGWLKKKIEWDRRGH